MVKIGLLKIILTTGFFVISGSPVLASLSSLETASVVMPTEEPVTNESDDREGIFHSEMGNLSFSHFTWGGELGSSIDLTSSDLSTFDADVFLGYKNKWANLLGVGAGIHRSIHTGNNFIPLYGLIRTSFTSRPALCFLNIQAGTCFNKIGSSKHFTDFYSGLGMGINLHRGSMARSYVILSLIYQYFSDDHKLMTGIDRRYLYFAKLSLGVNF